jgi:hypothetical protein
MDIAVLKIAIPVAQAIAIMRWRIKMSNQDELIAKIRDLAKREEMFLIRAMKIGAQAAIMRAKEERFLAEARELEAQRFELSLEYNRKKNPCPKILAQAEEALGRKLTVDEIFEIERMYAQKTAKHSAHTAH